MNPVQLLQVLVELMVEVVVARYLREAEAVRAHTQVVLLLILQNSRVAVDPSRCLDVVAP